MTKIPFNSLYDYATKLANAWDVYIVTQGQRMKSRVFSGVDHIALWEYRDSLTQSLRETLETYSPADVSSPLEYRLIAEIFFNLRFLSLIHYKCGERKQGWISIAFWLNQQLLQRWITEQGSLIAISNLHYLFVKPKRVKTCLKQEK